MQKCIVELRDEVDGSSQFFPMSYIPTETERQWITEAADAKGRATTFHEGTELDPAELVEIVGMSPDMTGPNASTITFPVIVERRGGIVEKTSRFCNEACRRNFVSDFPAADDGLTYELATARSEDVPDDEICEDCGEPLRKGAANASRS